MKKRGAASKEDRAAASPSEVAKKKKRLASDRATKKNQKAIQGENVVVKGGTVRGNAQTVD